MTVTSPRESRRLRPPKARARRATRLTTGLRRPRPRRHAADRLPLDDPYFSERPGYIGVVLAAAVVMLPLLIPSGPGNTGLVDVGILSAVATIFLWLRREQVRVTLPYALPVGLLIIAGTISAVNSDAESAVLAVVQDLFCLLWAAAVANAVRQRRWLLEVLLRAWVWSGIAWAGVLCVGRIAGISWMAGLTARDGGRASLTFNDPNLAANYFLVCVGLILATSVVRHRAARVGGILVVLLAIVFTGSNGAAVGLATMVGLGLLVGLGRRRGVLAAAAAAFLATTAVAVALPHLDLAQVTQNAADSIQLLKDSLGRTDESSGSREELASETMNLYLGGDLIGVGPGRTKETLSGTAAPYVKEAHNDYMATLVERGALGGVGLVVLIAAVAVRLGRTATWPQSVWVRQLVPRPEFLLALGAAIAVSSLFYEVLHFRHVWAFFGLVAGIDPAVRIFQDRRLKELR